MELNLNDRATSEGEKNTTAVPVAPSVSDSRTSLNGGKCIKDYWIEKIFCKRECNKFTKLQTLSGSTAIDRDRCVCGHHKLVHTQDAIDTGVSNSSEPWSAAKHTNSAPTDAFGQIDFQGATHCSKAQYVRLDYQSSPEHTLKLLLHHWQLELPKLLISVHGGISNFDLQPKLKRVFNKGLIKAANTTGAWIITGGTNTGVMRHVGQALAEKSVKKHKKHIVAIGIAPWGVVHRRHDLIAKDVAIDYHAAAHPRNSTAVLNSSHNYFLLSDNGTEGKYGAEVTLRKNLERYISHQRIHIRGEKMMKGCGVPLVCVVLEGGSNTIKTVLDYLTEEPPVPIVVCDGSGRAADLLAFIYTHSNEEGTVAHGLKAQLITIIKKTFSYNEEQAHRLFYELAMCVKKKKYITVFRMGEMNQDIDLPILTALLTCHNTSAPQQLNLALSWDRVDVARSHIFTYGQEWPEGSLDQAMLDALVQNKVDFVRLLLEKGVNIKKFLSIANLEELYNTRVGSTSTLQMMIRDIRKGARSNSRVTLIEIGQIIEKLMGGAFRSSYNRRNFKNLYYSQMTRHTWTHEAQPQLTPDDSPFPYPFTDLTLWAVLLKRQKLAMFMWRREEEALPKAIMVCRLYRVLADEAVDEPLLDNEVSEELYGYAKEFQKLALQILDHCYKEDDEKAHKLLTMELKNYSNQTCISLAHSAGMKDFIAHPCCQTLITNMWMGGLRMNKTSFFWIMFGIIFPPALLNLAFKTKEELQQMPQTVEEHILELEDSDDERDKSEADNEDLEAMDAVSLLEMGLDGDDASKLVTWQPVTNTGSSEFNQTSANGLAAKPTSLSLTQNRDISTPPALPSMLARLRKKNEELKLLRKVYEFYTAPVTKFWMHTLCYIAFMCLYNYIVLVKLNKYYPSWQEVYVMSYIFMHGIEMIREIVVSEPVQLGQKIRVFFSEKWNIVDLVSISLFWTGVVFRFQSSEQLHLTGRLLYCINIMFWYIRILDLFSVNKNLGPYVVIVGKMVMDMLNFIVILLIVLLSFGVARQAILNPYEGPSWTLAKNVFLEPYFMIYGEVYAGTIDPPCGPGHDIEVCYPGRWITPVIMSIYLLIANILLINLLIAVFNNTFQKNAHNSKEIWMFQRYSLTLEYEIKPIFPAPFVFISFIYLAVKWIVRRCKRKPPIKDYGLKLFLNDDEVRKIHDFEEDCVEDYFTNLEMKFESSTDEQIRATNERVENILVKIDDINQKENLLKLSMQAMEVRIANLEELGVRTYDHCYRSFNHVPLHYTPSAPCAMSSSSIETESPPINQNDRLLRMVSEADADRIRRLSGESYPPRQYSFPTTPRQKRSSNKTSAQQLETPATTTSSLFRRRRQKDLKPLKTSNNSETLTGRPKFFIDLGEQNMHHSVSATAGLPSIKESFHQTSTDELNNSIHASSAPTGHKKLQHVTSLPIKVTCQPHEVVNTELANQITPEVESSGEELSPDPSIQSLRSQSSPRLISARSFHTSNMAVNQINDPPPYIAFTPIKTSLRNEYTSITDSVDTACLLCSPTSSPNSASTGNRFIYTALPVSDKSNTFFPAPASGSSDPEKEYIEYEKNKLRDAEETENQVLGKRLKKRIRQISVDESHIMNDLAQLLIDDKGESPVQLAGEDELAATMPASQFRESLGDSSDIDLSASNHF